MAKRLQQGGASGGPATFNELQTASRRTHVHHVRNKERHVAHLVFDLCCQPHFYCSDLKCSKSLIGSAVTGLNRGRGAVSFTASEECSYAKASNSAPMQFLETSFKSFTSFLIFATRPLVEASPFCFLSSVHAHSLVFSSGIAWMQLANACKCVLLPSQEPSQGASCAGILFGIHQGVSAG